MTFKLNGSGPPRVALYRRPNPCQPVTLAAIGANRSKIHEFDIPAAIAETRITCQVGPVVGNSTLLEDSRSGSANCHGR